MQLIHNEMSEELTDLIVRTIQVQGLTQAPRKRHNAGLRSWKNSVGHYIEDRNCTYIVSADMIMIYTNEHVRGDLHAAVRIN